MQGGHTGNSNSSGSGGSNANRSRDSGRINNSANLNSASDTPTAQLEEERRGDTMFF